MRFRKLTLQLFLPCFLIAAISLCVVIFYSTHVYNRLYLQGTIEAVSANAYLLEREFSLLVKEESGHSKVDSLCKTIGKAISTRITVILPDGKVIGDSEKDPDSMENHANRPEVIQALAGEHGQQVRFSATLHLSMLYIAVPMRLNGERAVLRCAVPLSRIQSNEKLFYSRVALVSLVMLILLAVMSLQVSHMVSRPIQEMKVGAQRFASGDLGFKLPVPRNEELSDLVHALNTMAVALDERIHTVTSQRNELDAILTGMAEGVIAIDNKEHIISVNPAAARLLGLNVETVKGKWLHEIIRNSELQRFLSQTLTSETTLETSISFPTQDNGDRFVQAYGTALKNESGAPIGAVLVFNDITRLRQLENIRKEFVANVSHELRTPLTSIKGFVETIQTGSYDLHPDVSHFLDIIAAKTERLCSIVDDILTLSSIERDHEHSEINFAGSSVRRVLEDAIKTCEAKASSKQITLSLSCEMELQAKMNGQLLEQAIVNLIDNAIKYSNDGKEVNVSAGREGQDVVIAIADQGIGIPGEHIARIFERFYRVDKARSRKLGGTGLGLSIVKNIAIAHSGRVSVESELNRGSIFRIYLPAAS